MFVILVTFVILIALSFSYAVSYDDCFYAVTEEQEQHCFVEQDQKQRILNEIQALGGQRLNPSIKDTTVYISALNRYRKQSAIDDDFCIFPRCDPDGIVKRIAVKTKRAPEHLPQDLNRIWFNLTSLERYNFEDAAVLYYVGRIKEQYPNYRLKARFYYYITSENVEEYNVLSPARELDNITGMMSENDKWESFDVTALVRNWISDPEKNFGIMIKLLVEDSTGNVVYGENVGSSTPPAYLEIANTEFRSKTKRTIHRTKTPMCNKDDNKKNTSCCLFPISMAFDDINWDWVIAPKRLDFFYCAGYCTFASLKPLSYTQVLYSERPNDMCCAPETSDSVDILYQDPNGNLQLKTIPNLIVRSCACT